MSDRGESRPPGSGPPGGGPPGSAPPGSGPRPGRRGDGGLRAAARAIRELYEGIFIAPYRAALARERMRHQDLFLLLTLSDCLGIPNPVGFYVLELYPQLIGEYHDWHRRMGLEHAPEGGFRCC